MSISTCIHHPDKETRYHCLKHDIYLCEDCLECRDPDIYCKFRSSCPIHFMTKKNFNDEKANLFPDSCVYLQPTYFIDSDEHSVIAFAEDACKGAATLREKAVMLYYAVRDDIRYDPYSMETIKSSFKASQVLKKRKGFCIPKAVLLAAVARSQKIPSRLGFADVKNHLTTQRLKDLMKSDLFVYHGYVEMFLENKWVKATPAFNLSLCNHFNVKPLEFDGLSDSVFHEFDALGNRHMEYVRDHGHFEDLPFDRIMKAFMEEYPLLLDQYQKIKNEDFGRDAEKERQITII